MTTRTDKPLVFRRQRFYGAAEIGFTEDGTFVLNLYTYAPPFEANGNYFTTLPISPIDHRSVSPTRCAFRRDGDGDGLVIFDDWGQVSRIEGERELIEHLIAELVAHEIPRAAGGSEAEFSDQTKEG